MHYYQATTPHQTAHIYTQRHCPKPAQTHIHEEHQPLTPRYHLLVPPLVPVGKTSLGEGWKYGEGFFPLLKVGVFEG